MSGSGEQEKRLDKPARVHHTIFEVGIPERMVIECAQRHYEWQREGQSLWQIPIFTPVAGAEGSGAGTLSEAKISGLPVRIDKGHWDNKRQDWRARVTFSNGAVVDSAFWYSEQIFTENLRSADA